MQKRSKHALTVMRQILRATEMHSRELLRESGLTTSKLLLLQVLDDAGESTAGDVAVRLGITQATTTNLLQGLEEAALVTRRRGEADRRQVWIALTDAGRERLAAAPDVLQEKFTRRFEELVAWEQSMLIAALERIASILDAENIEAAPLLDTRAIAPPAPRRK